MSNSRSGHRGPARTGTLKTLAAVLVVLVLLPALIYSAFQLSALSDQESLIEDIYRQQLDVVLFSINQYAWDVVTSWFRELRNALSAGTLTGSETALLEFTRTSPSVNVVFETDTAVSAITLFMSEPEGALRADLASALKMRHSMVQRLVLRARSGYQGIESFQFLDTPRTIALVTPGPERERIPHVLGILVDVDAFVNAVLAPKLSEAAGEEFLLAVTQGDEGRLIYATAETSPTELRQSRRLWVLPDYDLWVRLQSGSLEELAAVRFRETLVLIIALDLLLLGGVWLVFRLTRREIELAELKSDFISSVSHELRTPLSLIRMSGETLLLGRVSNPERAEQHHQIIVRETDRLTRLVNNVLLYSRLEAGQKKVELEHHDVNGVVRSILDDYAAEFARRGFEVYAQYAPSPLGARLNAEAVTEALLNLLDNAMKFSEQEKILFVRTGSETEEVFLEVEDRGSGIPLELQKKIFERFYRVSPSSQNQKRGSGLGLTLVRQIMDIHGGHVDVRSAPGRGSTFRLSFPVSHEPETPT